MSLKNVFLMETTGNIVRMLGLAEPLAKEFTAMNQRADFALAKSFVLWHEATYGTNALEKKNVDKTMFEFFSWRREMGIDLAELLKTKPALEKKINTAKSNEEVMDILNAGKPEENVETLLDLGEGWKWVKLNDCHHSKEARMMQHCATDGRGDLVSLRDQSGNPHVTMTFNSKENVVYQIKGKQNAVPKDEYWDAIKDFFEKTKADIKDPFIKRNAYELFADIKKISGNEVDVSSDALMQKLAQAISSDAAKQWAWDTQPFTFDNPNVDYDTVEEIEEKITEVFKKSGYSFIEVEPSSGITEVFYHTSNWRKISDDPLDRIEEIPYYDDVVSTWQGITMYRMAESGIVNPSIAHRLKEFGMQNAAALNAVYKIFGEIFSTPDGYGVNEAISQEAENYVTAHEYDEMTGYEGSAGVGEAAYAKEKLEAAWEEYMHNKFYRATQEKWGPEYYNNPEYKKIKNKLLAQRDAGEPPPEE